MNAQVKVRLVKDIVRNLSIIANVEDSNEMKVEGVKEFEHAPELLVMTGLAGIGLTKDAPDAAFISAGATMVAITKECSAKSAQTAQDWHKTISRCLDETDYTGVMMGGALLSIRAALASLHAVAAEEERQAAQ